MEGTGFIGLVARRSGGSEVGRITDVITDPEGGEVTHVVADTGEERVEIPVSEVNLDSGTGAERSMEGPSLDEDERHSGQLVAEPESEHEAEAGEDLVREDWEDEASTPPESGYPRNDAYIDPETGEEREEYPEAEGDTTRAAVSVLLDGTGLEVSEVHDGVVRLTGVVSNREDLREVIKEVMGITEVREVDTTDVDVG